MLYTWTMPASPDDRHRRRVLQAIDHQRPDRVPIDFWATPEVFQRLCRELGLPDRESLLRRFGVDLRYVEGPAFVGQERRRHPDGTVEDLWGVRRKVVEVQTAVDTWRYKHVVQAPLASAESVADIEGYPGWPSPDWWDYSALARQCEEHAGHAVVVKGNRLDRTAQLKAMMYLRGMEQIYVDLAQNPALVEAMIERIRDYYLAYNERVFTALGGKAEIFMMGDDFGTQQGPMMSLRMWRRFFRPAFRAFVEQAHRHGLKVMHHSCGSVRYLMEEFIDAGLDILQALQPRARGMDLAELKREYGAHITFHGGMDIQQTLPLGTPAEVAADVRRLVQAGAPGGGYIICTAHNLLPDVPSENILAMIEAYREYC
jgi:uroporphyrinogen decarboxylase